MSRVLITGSEGFVGKYLRSELLKSGDEVIGLDRIKAENCFDCDLCDIDKVSDLLKDVHPDAIYHLAGQADVGKSWKEPDKTFKMNVLGAISLLEAARKHVPQASILFVGSSDQYGKLGEKGQSISEELVPDPQSPYAISKDTQEKIGLLYARNYRMRIILTRSFNHAGAGQKEGFMISDFAAGIARIELGLQEKLFVGNLDARRDFTHVKDVVKAYRLLVKKGKGGEVYNVGSGTAWQAREILDRLCSISTASVLVQQDPRRMRPSDTPVIQCDRSKLTRDTGWQPEFSIDDILRDTLEWYRDYYGSTGKKGCYKSRD